jgi:hypothetical protein
MILTTARGDKNQKRKQKGYERKPGRGVDTLFRVT